MGKVIWPIIAQPRKANAAAASIPSPSKLAVFEAPFVIKLIAEQDAAPQIRPRWWVGGLTGGGSVVEVVNAR